MSDEYIRKKDAIEWFQGMLDHDGSDYDIGVGGCIAAVKRHIPPADIKPVRHGHWIFNQDDMTLTCSDCGVKYNIDDVDGGLDFMEYAKYCLTCGARMDEVKDDDIH